MSFVSLNIIVGESKFEYDSILILKKVTFWIKILKGQIGEEDPKGNGQ